MNFLKLILAIGVIMCAVSCLHSKNVTVTNSGNTKVIIGNTTVNDGSTTIISGSNIIISGNPIKGNNDITMTEIPLKPFDSISTGIGGDITYHHGDEHKVVVTTDSNIIEFVVTKVSDKVLSLTLAEGSYSPTKLNFDIFTPELKNITISGSSDFTTKDTIQTSKFQINLNGSGTIKGKFEVENLIANLSGSGNMTASGKTNNLNIALSGAGNFDGKDLNADDSVVSISGIGNAKIHTTKSLDARVSGVGNITYSGNPANLSKNVSGVGKIRSI